MLDLGQGRTHRVPVRADRRPRTRYGLAVGRGRSWVAGLALLSAAVVAVLTVIGWPARDYRQGDFFQYWAGAHALLSGADPYDLGWWTRFHLAAGSRVAFAYPQPAGGPAWTTPYPLWTLAAFVPFAVLPFSFASALWLVAQLGAVAAGLAALARTVLRTEPRRDAVVLAAIAVAFQPLWLLPGNGNITGFVFAALVGSLALSARPLAAGGLLGALALKPQSVLVAALAVVAGAAPAARRRMVAGAAAVVAALSASSLALRPGWIGGWARSALALQSSTGSNATLWTLGRAVGVPVVSFLAPLALLLFLIVWLRLRRPGPLLLVGAAVPVSVALSPHGWTYDQLHLLITVAVIVELLSRGSAAARAVALGGLAVVAVVVPWLLYAVAFARDSEDWSALVPVLLLASLLAADRWWDPRITRPAVTVPRASNARSSEV